MKFVILISLSLFGANLFSQSFTEILKGVASDRDEDDRMGYAVAIDGNYAVVGAYADDFGPVDPNMGSAYVFEQQGLNNWVEIQKLVASDQDDYDRFGWSVAISGDYIIIGAYGEDEDENDANNMSKAGSAYIFEKDGTGVWNEVQKIVASDREASDEFGWSVAIEGTTAIVGAHIEDHDETGGNYLYHAGSVYVFDRDGGGAWNQSQKIVASDRSEDINYPGGYSGEDVSDLFGGSVDIWGDYLVVGAHHHDYGPAGPPTGALWSSGAAYIFERNAGVWSEVQKIQNFDREGWDRFGYAVAVDSIYIAVSAYSEDEIEDGVSDPLTNPGSVYIFERDGGGTWNPAQKIVPNDRSSGDHFGYSVDIRDSLMVIGTHSDDHDETGGDLLTDAGSTYIFQLSGGTWTQFQKIDASDRKEGDEHGIDVGISGNTIVCGALYQDFNDVGIDSLEDAGAAYFYSNITCSPSSLNQNISICDGSSYDIGSSSYTSAGTYVDVLISSSGCDSTVTTNLTLAPATVVDQYVSICFGDTYYLGGAAYTTSGNYSELFTASNGCDSTIITHLTVEDQITSEQFVSICYGETYTIGTSTYSVNGTYQDVVTASNFCDSTITTHLTVELPVITSISQSVNMLISNSTGPGFQWFNCDTGTPVAGATEQTFFATQIGSYGVIVTEGGCTDTSACVYVSYISSEVNTNTLDSQISVYPNPNQGSFEINLSDIADAEIQLYNSLGELVLSDKANSSSYHVNDLKSGVYLLRISIGEEFVTKRIVVM